MLLAIDFMVRHTGEDLVDEEGIAVASMLSFQAPGIDCTELDAPEADRLSTDGDATFGEKIFNIPVTQIEAMVEPCWQNSVVTWSAG